MSLSMIPALETERLVLRAPEERDLAPLIAYFEAPDSHFVGGPMSAVETERAMLTTLGSWALYGFGLWHIGEKPSGDFIGWVGPLKTSGRPEPGFAWTVLPGAQRKGYAREAAQAALLHTTEYLGQTAPATFIKVQNTVSQHVAAKLGFALEAEAEGWLTYRYAGKAA